MWDGGRAAGDLRDRPRTETGARGALATARPRAYSYLRFSTPEQQQGDSFRRQTEAAKLYADRRGLALDEQLTFRDLGVSAFRGRNAERGSLADFRLAVQTGTVAPGSFLLIESFDRLSRMDPWEALPIFQEIINAGITIVTLTDSREWNRAGIRENPFRILESLLVMMRAHEESATKGRRVRAAWENKRKRAAERPLTARCPAWLRLDRTTNPPKWEQLPARVRIVQRVYEMAAAGRGYEAITGTLNRERAPTFGRGRFWGRSYVQKLLGNAAVIGRMVPHTQSHGADGKRVRQPEAAVEGYFPAVVDPDVFARVQAMRLNGRRQPSPKGNHVTHLVAGLAKCSHCGGSLTRVSKGPRGGRPKLVCRMAKEGAGCASRPVVLEDVEAAILENIGRLVGTAPSGSDELDGKAARLETLEDAVTDQINNLIDAISAGNKSPALEARLRALENEREAVKAERAELTARMDAIAPARLANRLQDFEATMGAGADKAAMNASMRQIFRAVTVDRGAGTLVFEWSHGGESRLMFAWPENAVGEGPAAGSQ